MHDHMEVIYELCVPHFYHAFRNLLIINAFNILHRQVEFKPNYLISIS